MHKNSRQTATGGCPMHMRSGYYVRGDAEPCKPGNPLENPTDVPAPEALSPYCRIFEPKPTQPEDERLIALGKTMRDDGSQASVNANIPAGYTYLGQFIDHDITAMDGAADLTDTSPERVENLQNMRTHTLDLDSVYQSPDSSISLREGDNMKIGVTTAFGGSTNFELPNDLPRDDSKKALIGDERNDENLAVAQTHLAFLKLHNRFVEQVGMNFDAARIATIQHYQSMVINDFLRRIISPGIFSKVFESSYTPDQAEKIDCMPIEFAAAAFRFGHSMVRNRYEWNRIFRTGGELPPATLGQLFQFSGLSGDLAGLNTLPTNWIVDWRRLYDFGLGNQGPAVNMARKIDVKLALNLGELPGFPDSEDDLSNLSVRNLLRGKQMQLPTGQQLAREIGVEDISDDMGIGIDEGLNQQTPLWYYILREAAVQQEGNSWAMWAAGLWPLRSNSSF